MIREFSVIAQFSLACAVVLGSSLWLNMFGQTEDFKLIAPDGQANDEFGFAVAIDGDRIAAGAPYDDDNGSNSGAVYLFDVATGSMLFKLTPDDGEANAEFGYSVAMDNGILAVGARGDNDNGTLAGAAYLFDASTGTQLQKLVPNDAQPGDEFGNSIDIANGLVVAGAWRADEFGDGSGAAYLFDASSGAELEKLLPDEGANFQTFGVSVAIDSEVAAVGARTYFSLGAGYTFAKAYLFNTTTGELLNTLQPDILNYNGDLGGHFADCMDMENGLIAVGTPFRSVVFDHSGAAYVFDVTTGAQLSFITPDDGHDQDNFGISIALSEGYLAIGSHEDDDNGFSSGSAYVFEAESGQQITKIIASDGQNFDLLGSSISFDSGTVAVGAKTQDANGEDSGAVYLFNGFSGGCTDSAACNFEPNTLFDNGSCFYSPCINLVDADNNGIINTVDLLEFLGNLGCAGDDCFGDINQDGVVDIEDLLAFLTWFGTSYP